MTRDEIVASFRRNHLLEAADEAGARASPPQLTTVEIACRSQREADARIAESFAQDYPDLAEVMYKIANVIRRR